MAARRISKSAINWAALSERIPESQRVSYSAFKAKSDEYLRRVMSYPEQLPAIDWSFYKTRITVPGLVDEFEKNFKALKVPFPQDTQTAQINALDADVQKKMEKFVADSKAKVKEYQIQLDRLNALLPVEDMSMEEFAQAFPDSAWDPDNPTMDPHDEPPPTTYIDLPRSGHH